MKKIKFDADTKMDILICAIFVLSAIINVICYYVLSGIAFKVVRIILVIPYALVSPFSPFYALHHLLEILKSDNTGTQKLKSIIVLGAMIFATWSVALMFNEYLSVR